MTKLFRVQDKIKTLSPKKVKRSKASIKKEYKRRAKECKALADSYIKKQLATHRTYNPPDEFISLIRAVMQLKREIKRIRGPELLLQNYFSKNGKGTGTSRKKTSDKKSKNTEMDL